MPPDAFSDMDDRLEIIAGEADVTPETARKILDKIFFYPPAQHAYQCSICGRACDMECYVEKQVAALFCDADRTQTCNLLIRRRNFGVFAIFW